MYYLQSQAASDMQLFHLHIPQQLNQRYVYFTTNRAEWQGLLDINRVNVPAKASSKVVRVRRVGLRIITSSFFVMMGRNELETR